MIRLILVLIIIAALSLGLAWVADEPGRVSIDWANYHLETSVLVVLAGIVILTLGFMCIYVLLYTIIRTPRSWMRARLAKRQTLGLAALTEAFTAIATQDIGAAKRQIARAQQHLPNQPLTLMLASQVARIEGNESQAHLYLEQMLKSEGTEFIALRGLIENARRTHNNSTALKYAEKALAIKPQDPWLITTTIGLYVSQSETQKAVRLIESSLRKNYIPRQDARRLSAYVLYENAMQLTNQQRWDFSIAVLEDVLRKQADFIPASALLAKAYIKQGEVKRALKVIANAWRPAPHPLLTETLLDCWDANKDQRRVVHTAEKLASFMPEHRESQFLLAELAIRQNDRRSARAYLSHLLQNKETARACRLMAELENMNDDHEQAAKWLKRASSAQPDSKWICNSCLHASDKWNFTCEQCGSVASLSWK